MANVPSPFAHVFRLCPHGDVFKNIRDSFSKSLPSRRNRLKQCVSPNGNAETPQRCGAENVAMSAYCKRHWARFVFVKFHINTVVGLRYFGDCF